MKCGYLWREQRYVDSVESGMCEVHARVLFLLSRTIC